MPRWKKIRKLNFPSGHKTRSPHPIGLSHIHCIHVGQDHHSFKLYMSQNQWPQCVLFSSPWYMYLLLSVRMCSILITSVSPPGGQPSTNCSSSGEPMPIARTWQGRPNHCQRETKVEVDVWFMHNSIVNVAVDSPADRGVSGWFSSQKLECWCTLSPGCVDTSWGGGGAPALLTLPVKLPLIKTCCHHSSWALPHTTYC